VDGRPFSFLLVDPADPIVVYVAFAVDCNYNYCYDGGANVARLAFSFLHDDHSDGEPAQGHQCFSGIHVV